MIVVSLMLPGVTLLLDTLEDGLGYPEAWLAGAVGAIVLALLVVVRMARLVANVERLVHQLGELTLVDPLTGAPDHRRLGHGALEPRPGPAVAPRRHQARHQPGPRPRLGLPPGRRRAMAQWADSVGATVCAEGIETQERLDALSALGVHWGQGSLLGRPGEQAEDIVRPSLPVGLSA